MINENLNPIVRRNLPRNAVFFLNLRQDIPTQHEPRAAKEREGVYLSQTLVLNATYEPLGVVSERRALILVLNERATSVEDSDRILTYARGSITLPSVIKLNKFVKIPYRHAVPLSRRAIFARDNNRCVYCGVTATSIDHVIPRSRGGGHNWENVVSACHKCNHAKADRTLKDLGWRLRHTPREPVGAAWRILGTGKPLRIWIPYLKPFGVEAMGAASA